MLTCKNMHEFVNVTENSENDRFTKLTGTVKQLVLYEYCPLTPAAAHSRTIVKNDNMTLIATISIVPETIRDPVLILFTDVAFD